MNKELLDKVVCLHTEIDNVGKKIEAIKSAKTVLLLDSNDEHININISEDAISFIRERYEANQADLQAELNKYEIVDSVPTTRASDSPDFYWAKYVTTNKDGEICALESLPEKGGQWWWPLSTTRFKTITPEQAIALCGRVPQWEDEEPTPVINR